MIPKIIHYCWFGSGQLTDSVKRIKDTWAKFNPDFEIVEWNEANFDINSNTYVREAYESKKYAFVSDYARLVALEKYGGIYLDTDVEVKRNLEKFLINDFTLGFESIDRIGTAVIISEPHIKLISDWKNSYDKRRFIVDGKYDTTTNVTFITNYLRPYLEFNGTTQYIEGLNGTVYEKNVFYPYSIGDDKSTIDKDSYTVHWCDATWVSGKEMLKLNCIKSIKRIIGTDMYEHLRRKIKGIQ